MTTSNNKTPQERRDALMRGARFFDKSRDSIRRTRTIVDESRNRRFTPEESLAVGLDLIKRFYIFPARAGFKDPLIRGYDTLASRDPAKITKWAEKNPGCNWGISLVRNRIWPADVDTKEGKQGLETRAAIEREHGGWPLTFRVITPSGGFHDYYRGDHQFGLGVAGFGEGIDSPRYLVAPGCKLVDARYMRQEKDGREVEVKRQIGGVYEADFLVEEIVERPDFFPVLFAKAADRKAERKRKQREKIGVTGAVYSYDELAAIVELIDIHKFHSDHDTADEPDRWVRLILSMVDGSTCDEDVRDLALDLSMRDDRYAWDFDGIEKQIDHMASRTTDDVGVTVDTFNWFAANNAIDGKADEMAKLIKWTFATSAQDDFEGDDPEAETIETEQAAIVTELVEVMKQWVWVSTLDRFIDRTDSTIVLKKDAFNDKYRYLSPKGPLSNFLHSRREHTILKPDRVVYRPGEGEFLRGGRDWNLWRPSEIVAAEGDTSVWDKHLEYLLPDAGSRSPSCRTSRTRSRSTPRIGAIWCWRPRPCRMSRATPTIPGCMPCSTIRWRWVRSSMC